MNCKSFKTTITILMMALLITAFFKNTCHAIIVTPSASPATVNTPVSFHVYMGVVGCNMDITYGDGGSDSNGNWANSEITFTHTYTRPGLYTVNVAASGACVNNGIHPPPSKSFTLRVSDFNIKRMELKFKNNQSKITMNRNEKTPELYVKLKFSGSGFLKGYWEVDGLRKNYVFKHLAIGPTHIIKYPKIPSLPTYTPGTHRVRFIITQPALNITFPTALYFVTNKEDISRNPIKLLFPENRDKLAYEPIVFQWETIDKAPLYLLSLLTEDKKEKAFSAFTRQGRYELKPKILKSRLKPETQYLWQVTGFNDQDKIVAQSRQRSFSFAKAVTFVPGNILFVTNLTKQGEKAISDLKTKFNLQMLDQYEIVSLKQKATLFFTKIDIFKIIDTAKTWQDIVSAQPNFIFSTMSEPMSNLQNLNKLLKINNLNSDLKGRGVKIGIVDTGVDAVHKDLESAIIYSKNFIGNDKDTAEIHGTAVAGIIGARENNFGIKGLAPESKLLALRACRQVSREYPIGECYSSTMVKALDTGIQNNAKIINMSLGAMVEDKLMSKLITAGSDQGILFVAPAGNTKEINYLSFPASHPKVIAVAGSDENGSFFPNNTIGEKADFCTPCKNLFTTTPDNNHNFISGTSMSTAVVSGLLALSCEKNPELDLKDLNTFKGDLQALINHIKTKL